MRERPILFSGPMVRAILEGRKTQTRRVVKPEPASVVDNRIVPFDGPPSLLLRELRCPFGNAGDRLWVRETWAPMCRTADPHCWCESDPQRQKNHYVEYRADTGDAYPGDWPAEEARGYEDAPKWRPSIHMPRWASRLTLEVTRVRVERLQEIGGFDAKREGVVIPAHIPQDGADLDYARRAFAALWDTLNAERGHGWFSNPWVWVLDFTVVPATVLQEATA